MSSFRRQLAAIFSGRSSALLMPSFLVAALAVNVITFSSDARAAVDMCTEDGGTAECVGAEVGPYHYGVSASFLVVQGSEEASTVSAFTEGVRNYFDACTLNVSDNAPPWPPVPAGAGSASYFNGSQHWHMNWLLSQDTFTQRRPLVYSGTRPRTGSPGTPACSVNFDQVEAQIQRTRDVACPGAYNNPFLPNNATAPLGAYCYRPGNAFDQAKNLGQQCPLIGNPTNPASGNKFQAETDYVGTGPMPLRFTRYYNSHLWKGQSPPSGGQLYWSRLGYNWRSSYDGAIRFADSVSHATAHVYRPDGRTLYFKKQSNGQFLADADIADRLVRLTDGGGNATGWKYTSAENEEVETYDVTGKLVALANRTGVTQTLTYDTSGRLSAVADAFGRTLSFTYDANNRPATLTDPANQVYSYAYNSAGNVSSVTYPDSTVRTYVYNEAAHTGGANRPYVLTGIIDEGTNRYATYKYDGVERVVSTEHGIGAQKYSFSYVGDSRIVTDPLNTARTYSFSNSHGVARNTAISQPCTSGCGGGAAAATSYDPNGNVASKTDFNGNKTCYAYDTTRNIETARLEGLASGLSCPANLSTYTPTPGTRQRTISTQWHSTYRLPTQIDEAGKRTTFTHDANGNVLTKTVLDTTTTESRTWTYTYNSSGQVLTADGPRTDVSDVTTYTYYSCTTGSHCGQVQTITNALSHVTTYNTYNAHGQPLTITDPNGIVTTLTYDLRQRLTSRTVGAEQTTFTYWPTGLLKKATLPDGSFLEYTYDAAHRLTEIQDSEGNRIVYTLDNVGNRTAENLYDPSSLLTQTRTRVFDTLNRLWKEIGAAGSTGVTTAFSYDNNGNQTAIDAPLSRSTVQAYDELNRLKQVTDPVAGVTQYGYNALDQLISVTDPRSSVTSYTYNGLGDLTQQLSPDTGTTTSSYDSGGNLQTSTDARSKTATYAYDALNRVTSVMYSDQTIGYTYDSGTNQNGRLTQVTDASGSTSWSYDTHGRVLSRQQSMGVTKTVGYAYDSAGRLQSLTLPSGNTIAYGYADGKITTLTLNGSSTILSNVLYQPFGPTRGWTWGNATLAVREYDIDGKITDIDSAGLKSYGYDDAFRIASISDTTDANLSATHGYDAADRLVNYVPGQALTPSVSPSATSVPAGGSFSVTVSGVSARPDYWLALASTSVPSSTYSKWSAVTLSAGSFVWNLTAPDFPGTYEVRLFAGGFARQATSVPVTITATTPAVQPALAPSAGRAAPSASVTVRLTGSSGAAGDWLALAQVGAPNTSTLQWTSVGLGVTSRDWTVTMPATSGNYEFRLMNNAFTILATSPPVTLTSTPPVAGAPAGPAAYTYDLNGNRLTGEGSTHTISSTSNRVTSISGALSRTYSYDNSGNTTGDGTATFTYNDAGRMVSATKASVTTTYALNALGQRVKKTTAGSSRYFVYDEAGHLVGEYDNSGSLIQETVWFGDIPVATLRPNGAGVNVFYIHTDHLNTPRRISRPSDNVVVWRWDSDPFGTTAANEDPDGDSNLFAYGLRFPGQYFDAETGLHYNYYRDYDPQTGRYGRSDPIGLLGGLNTFGYVSGNPLSLLDPLGLRTIYRWPPNSYGDVPPPGVSCEEAIFSGGILMGWKPCESGNGCNGDQPMPGPYDYNYDGWPSFDDAPGSGSADGYRPWNRPQYWNAASSLAGTHNYFPGLLGCVYIGGAGSGGLSGYAGCGVGVGASSIRPSWQNSLNFGDPSGWGVRGSISGGFFGGAGSASVFVNPHGVNFTISAGPGGGGTGNVTFGYRARRSNGD